MMEEYSRKFIVCIQCLFILSRCYVHIDTKRKIYTFPNQILCCWEAATKLGSVKEFACGLRCNVSIIFLVFLGNVYLISRDYHCNYFLQRINIFILISGLLIPLYFLVLAMLYMDVSNL